MPWDQLASHSALHVVFVGQAAILTRIRVPYTSNTHADTLVVKLYSEHLDEHGLSEPFHAFPSFVPNTGTLKKNSMFRAKLGVLPLRTNEEQREMSEAYHLINPGNMPLRNNVQSFTSAYSQKFMNKYGFHCQKSSWCCSKMTSLDQFGLALAVKNITSSYFSRIHLNRSNTKSNLKKK